MAIPVRPGHLEDDLGVPPTGEPGPPTATDRAPRPRGRVAPLTALAAVTVAGAALLPLVYLAVRASEIGVGAAAELVLTDRTLWLLVRSLGLAVAVTATAVAIGVPVGWLTARAKLPGHRTFTVLTALPLAVPSYVAALAVIATFGPRGTIARWLGPLGVDELPELYGFPGAWLALSLSTFPYVTLTVRGALRRLDPALEEMSRSLGIGPWATLRRVTLPQLAPAVAAGGLLVALYTLADFGAVSLLRYDTFTRVIYVQYRGSLDRSSAAVLALVLAAVSLAVVAGEGRIRSRARAASARSARRPHPGPLARWSERAAYAGYAVPGLVVALSLVFFGARVATPMYQTVWMLVFAYMVLFLPQGVGALRTTLAQVSPRLEEASRSLGVGRLRTAWRVLLPLVRPGAVAAFALVFLTAMKELPAALLLGPTGWDTLATRVWATTSEGFFARAAPAALLLMAVSSVPLAFLALRGDDSTAGSRRAEGS